MVCCVGILYAWQHFQCWRGVGPGQHLALGWVMDEGHGFDLIYMHTENNFYFSSAYENILNRRVTSTIKVYIDHCSST
jgi:hypothetical protein